MRLWLTTLQGGSSIFQMRHLRSLNVRNLPAEDWGAVKISHRVLVEELVRNPFSHKSKLQLIALGAITSKDHWEGRSNWADHLFDYHFSPRFYHFEHHLDINGESHPVLT